MLDIKSKSSKLVAFLMVLFIILTSSIGMLLSYPKIEKLSEQYRYNIYEVRTDILRDIVIYNYCLYYKTITKNNEIPYSELFMDMNTNSSSYIEAEKNNYIEQFNGFLDGYSYQLEDILNLEYYVLNKENSITEKRSSSEIEKLFDINYNSKDIDEKYDFYIVFDYDDKGNLKIEKVYGADKTNVEYQVRNIEKEKVVEDFIGLKPIKNAKFVYAIQKDLAYSDNISDRKYEVEYSSIEQTAILFVLLTLVFFVVISFFIPYKGVKEIKIFNKIINLPIEIVFILISILFLFIILSPTFLIPNTIANKFESFLNSNIIYLEILNLDLISTKTLVYFINILYWIAVFSGVVFSVLIFKHILKSGIKNYIKNNCLTYKIFGYAYYKIKKFIKTLDLKDSNTKRIFLVSLINFAVVSIMCITWFIGLFGALIYSVVVFVLLNNFYKQASEDYNKLLDITKEIANGNLDVSLDEDMGIFSSYKAEIINIKTGFKKAVEEEVKSQKMKTELISNVSHDLKTPLTSIISYTDLLKNEDITKEQQKEYIEILDKKSKRLQTLIEDLFEASKASSGDINLNIDDVDIVSLVKQTLVELDDKIKEQSLIIKSNMPNDKLILRLDSQRTFRVFENIIVNITKYALENSRVYIDIIDFEDKVEISFRNISKEEIDFTSTEITERFVRGDKSRNTEGSGLGLSIAKSFVELQGGKFDIIIDGDLFKVIIIFDKK